MDTEVSEQTFSWLSPHAGIIKLMNEPHFMFYLLCEFDLENRNFK